MDHEKNLNDLEEWMKDTQGGGLARGNEPVLRLALAVEHLAMAVANGLDGIRQELKMAREES